MTMKNNSTLINKKTGEEAVIVAVGEKITVRLADGSERSYAESSLKKLFKQADNNSEVAASDNTVTTEEETKVDDTIANEEKVDDTIANEEKVDDTIANEEKVDDTIANEEKVDDTKVDDTKVGDTKVDDEKVDGQQEGKEENKDGENKAEDAPKPDKKEKFITMYNKIIDSLTNDDTIKDMVVKPLCNNYSAIKVKKNFVEFGVSSKQLKVTILPVEMETKLPVKIAPKSFGWRLTNSISMTDESQLDEVVRLIKLSYNKEIAPAKETVVTEEAAVTK